MKRVELEKLNSEMEGAFAGWIIVPGEGRESAKAVLIGEAPGEKEELNRRPFVGKAGENLNEFLRLSGLERDELYITNTVKLRPSAIGKSGRKINRKPTKAEIEAFLPYLLREIEIIDPIVIVTLGNVPLNALCGEELKIGDVHGRFIGLNSINRRLYPMYHPASVIYRRELKQVYAEDVKRLGEWMRRNV